MYAKAIDGVNVPCDLDAGEKATAKCSERTAGRMNTIFLELFF